MKSALSTLALVTSAVLGLASPKAAAASSTYELSFGPFVGGGKVSTGAKVRDTSGYALSIGRPWQLSERLSLGPVLEVSNALVNTRAADGEAKAISTYDNRIFAAGVRLATPVGNEATFAQALYLSALFGRGFTKLAVDESTPSSFTQKLYRKIEGNYYSGELGAFVPMKESFGLNIAFLGSSYEVDQSKKTGTYSGDELRDGQLYLTEGKTGADDELPKSALLRSYALKIGLSLGF